jgi:hypothetical protein
VYDKITRSEVVSLVELAKHKSGLRSPLTQISKLILVCQKAGADVSRVRWFISFIYFRLTHNLLAMNTPLSDLKVRVLPEMSIIHEMITALPPLLPYPPSNDGKPAPDTVWVTSTSANVLWYERRQTTKDNIYGMTLDLTPSALLAVQFMDALYRGEEERTLLEMMHNCKAMSAVQKLDYAGLGGGGFKDRLMAQYTIDTQPPLAKGDDDAGVAPAAPEVDPDLLERDRKLQELLSRKPTQKSKDITCDMACMWHAMAVTCKCGVTWKCDMEM